MTRKWWGHRRGLAGVLGISLLLAMGVPAGSATASESPPALTVNGLHGVTAISTGNGFFLALVGTGRVYAWGVNNLGQLGDGTTTNSTTPVLVKGLTGVKAISAGGFASVALLGDGTLMAWGSDRFGQLGNGASGGDSTVPVNVLDVSGVASVSAGLNHDLAQLENGSVWAWGNDATGELGNGQFEEFADTPVEVVSLTGAASVSAGDEFSLALLRNGTVRSWGSNSNGQLGMGNINPAEMDTPVAVKDLRAATAVSAGVVHALALLSSGTAVGWGDDQSGELGNGVNPPFYTVPVRVHHLVGASAVVASALPTEGSFSLALLTSGSVDKWGATTPPSEVPIRVPKVSHVKAISAGLFLLTDGTVEPFTP